MDAGKRQWIVAILGLTVGISLTASAGQVYIYGGDFNLRIPADPDNTRGWMDDAVIEIPDHFPIADLDVCITITHSSVFDLQLFLQSPTGTRLCLNMYNLTEYFDGENYTQTIFDDESELSIEQAQPPFTGRFRPEPGNALSIFDGLDTYGSWRLQINDMYYADSGVLDRFELMICGKIPADLNTDGEVDFVDYVELSGHWRDQTCVSPGWCEGADFNQSGSVDLSDLAQFVEYWLEGK
jgi:subtilisin-like proprotein convertase family protein